MKLLHLNESAYAGSLDTIKEFRDDAHMIGVQMGNLNPLLAQLDNVISLIKKIEAAEDKANENAYKTELRFILTRLEDELEQLPLYISRLTTLSQKSESILNLGWSSARD